MPEAGGMKKRKTMCELNNNNNEVCIINAKRKLCVLIVVSAVGKLHKNTRLMNQIDKKGRGKTVNN